MTRYYGSAVFEQHEVADSDYNALTRIRIEEANSIVATKNEFERQYKQLVKWKEDQIDSIHAHALSEINYILSAVYTLPVYMLRCAKGPCEYCRAKYGTIGTYAELERLDCIPPFHEDCRCWLEQVGYVVMSGVY